MNRVCFFSVLHKLNLNYFGDFINSLINQTYKNFDLILLLDNIKSSEIDKKLNLNSRTKVYFIEYSSTIIENRLYALNYLSNLNYEFILFGDTDDFFNSNRVKSVLRDLENYPIVVNDLVPFSNSKEINLKHEKYWSSRFKDSKVLNANFLKDKNILGFGNTSIQKNVLKNFLNIKPNHVSATDWYIFSHFENDGSNIKFNNSALTFYRQHEFNIVGSKKLDFKSFIKNLNVKKNHYECLGLVDSIYYTQTINLLSSIMKVNNNKSILEIINNQNINYFWWEEGNNINL